MNPINKKRCINFDEEPLVIFFSKLDDNLSYQDRIEITDKQETTPIGTPFVIPFKDLLMFQT